MSKRKKINTKSFQEDLDTIKKSIAIGKAQTAIEITDALKVKTKPTVFFGNKYKPEDVQKILEAETPLALELVETDFKLRTLSRRAFDKVEYPKRAIPAGNSKLARTIDYLYLRKINGKLNCIKYYCKNPEELTQMQIRALYAERSFRYRHGYLINDKPATPSALKQYFSYIDDLHRKYEGRNNAYKSEYEIIEAKDREQKITGIEREAPITKWNSRTQREIDLEALKEVQSNLRTKLSKLIDDSYYTFTKLDDARGQISGVRLPDGSRLPTTGIGLNTYFKKNNLKTVTDIITCYGAGKDKSLIIKDYVNLGYVLQDININAQEAFEYICSYLNKYAGKRKVHTENREAQRGGLLLKNLFDFFDAEVNRTTNEKQTNKRVKIFSQNDLMKSEQYANYCVQSGTKKETNIKTFNKWFLSKKEILKSKK